MTWPVPDLSEVRGQLEARRGLEIALAGGHGIVFVGPPGSGKTLLARTIPGLLPPLDDAAALEVTVVASAAGERSINGLIRQAPFRAPHHTTSYAAMVGGGPRMSPGEVTLADHGVLFLDELPEFGRDVLEALRQPLEEGRVAIARVGRATTFPARFQLVAAMNPCPCGFAGDDAGRCRCPTSGRRALHGPCLRPAPRPDRPVGHDAARPAGSALVGGQEPEGSLAVARRIAADACPADGPLGRAAQRPAVGPHAARSAASTRSRLAASSSCPSANGCPAAGPNGCSASLERSPTWVGRRRSASPSSRRRRGSARRPCASRKPWPVDVLGVSSSGPVALPPPGPTMPSRSRPPSPERDAWTVLAAVHGLGPVGLAALLVRYGSGVAILREATSPGGVDAPGRDRPASSASTVSPGAIRSTRRSRRRSRKRPWTPLRRSSGSAARGSTWSPRGTAVSPSPRGNRAPTAPPLRQGRPGARSTRPVPSPWSARDPDRRRAAAGGADRRRASRGSRQRSCRASRSASTARRTRPP